MIGTTTTPDLQQWADGFQGFHVSGPKNLDGNYSSDYCAIAVLLLVLGVIVPIVVIFKIVVTVIFLTILNVNIFGTAKNGHWMFL